MGSAKECIVKVIPSKIANEFIRTHHYSGKVVNNSSLHFGVFYHGGLHGVMSFGPSLDKSNIIGLVADTGWNEFLELNRMAFDEVLPRNSESRCISIAMRLIKKNAPHVKWVISFADACSCGDGTIYRASGFLLVGAKKNTELLELPNGEKIHELTLRLGGNVKRKALNGRSYRDIVGIDGGIKKFIELTGSKVIPGYQMKYIYFIDKSWRKKLTVPVIPFSKIDEIGAGMYLGEKIARSKRSK